MNERLFSRRDLLRKTTALGVLAVVGSACTKSSQAKGPSCADTSSLSASDVTVRQALGYVDISTEPGKTCDRCQQFLPTTPDTCGTCKVVRGPINPRGYCKSFVVKPS